MDGLSDVDLQVLARTAVEIESGPLSPRSGKSEPLERQYAGTDCCSAIIKTEARRLRSHGGDMITKSATGGCRGECA